MRLTLQVWPTCWKSAEICSEGWLGVSIRRISTHTADPLRTAAVSYLEIVGIMFVLLPRLQLYTISNGLSEGLGK